MANALPIAVGELIEAGTINTWARGWFRKTTSKTVNTTTTATDLLNGECTLPAGAMGTDKIVRLTAWGDWKQDSGAARDIPGFLLLLGGTTLLNTNNSGVAAATNVSTRWPWRFVCEIQNLGVTNSQWAHASGRISYAFNASGVALATTGEGQVIAQSEGGATYDTCNIEAVDTTAACALVFKVQNANNSANYETKLLGALVEII